VFQAEDGIRDRNVTGVQTCALPILKVKNRRRSPMPIIVKKSGLSKNKKKLLSNYNKPFLKFFSIIGAKIKASINGAIGKPNFFIKKPNTPKATMTYISKTLLLIAYEPTIQKIITIGYTTFSG